MPTKRVFSDKLNPVLIGLLFVIAALVPFHAFFSISLKALWGAPLWIQAWKDVLLLLVLFAIAARTAITRTLPFVVSRYDIALFALFGFAFIAALIHPQTAVFGLKTNLTLFAAYLAARSIPGIETRFGELAKLLLTVSVLAAALGIIQVLAFPRGITPHDIMWNFGYSSVSGYPPITYAVGTAVARAQSFFAGPNQFAAYLLIPIGLLLGRTPLRPKELFLLGLFVVTLYLTHSRSAWIGGLTGYGAYRAVKMKKWPRPKWWQLLGVLAAVSVLAFLAPRSIFIQRVFLHGDIRDNKLYGSTAAHFEGTVAALVEAKQHLLIGKGLGTVGPACQQAGGTNCMIPENFYLQLLLELGSFGLILFGIVILGWFRMIFGHPDQTVQRSLAFILTGTLVGGLFLHVITDSAVQMTLGIIMGIAQRQYETRRARS